MAEFLVEEGSSGACLSFLASFELLALLDRQTWPQKIEINLELSFLGLYTWVMTSHAS